MRFLQSNLQTGMNDNTTFQDGLTYKGRGGLTSYDDGARALPDSLADVTKDGVPIKPASVFNPSGFTPKQIEVWRRFIGRVGCRPEEARTGYWHASIDGG